MKTLPCITRIIAVMLCIGVWPAAAQNDEQASAQEPPASNQSPTKDQSAQDADADRSATQRSEARTATSQPPQGFDKAALRADERLQEAVAELKQLREQIADQKIPMSQRLQELEQELARVRETFQEKQRTLDTRRLNVSNLKKEIQAREEEASYLSDLFGQYARNFESRLHIAELQRYQEAIKEAKLAPDNSSLSRNEMFDRQLKLIDVSFGRLEDGLGGAIFQGSAVDPDGNVRVGKFALIGPAAVFRSKEGAVAGAAEQRLGSMEPTIIPYESPELVEAASAFIESGEGEIPLDPTLGNAVKIQATEDTLWQHIQKGGPVMVPIFTLAGISLIVGLIKWVTLMMVRMPPQKQVDQLLGSVRQRDEAAAKETASRMRGPVGAMLRVGVEYFHAPRELIEEAMYEKVLATRIRLQRMLPFIAITAASAPLLGLLGTVTGIISTFELITVFGTGDVQTLSGGISEALITTKFGLIVAVPTLLLHAFLARKAKGVVDQMEKSAVALANQISYSRDQTPAPAGADAARQGESDDDSAAGAEDKPDAEAQTDSDAAADSQPEPVESTK